MSVLLTDRPGIDNRLVEGAAGKACHAGHPHEPSGSPCTCAQVRIVVCLSFADHAIKEDFEYDLF